MDIGKSFGYVFEDEKWVTKILLGGVIFLIPIIGQLAVIGYGLKVAQNVAQGNPRPLPDWNEFGDHITRGFYGFIIQIVYLLPAIILYFLAIAITSIGAAATTNQYGHGGGGAIVGLCLFPLVFVLALAGSIVAFAGEARYVVTGSLSEALKFNEVLGMVRRNPGPWLMLLVVNLLAGIVGGLGAIACGVGVLFTAFFAYCVRGHALGQTVVSQGMLSDYGQTQPQYTPPPSYGPPSAY